MTTYTSSVVKKAEEIANAQISSHWKKETISSFVADSKISRKPSELKSTLAKNSSGVKTRELFSK